MIDLELWRAAVVALDEWACNGDKGRDKRDPVYREVTEGRDVPPYTHYSSCADRAHWRLWRLGVREPWVNRAPHWKPGANISLLWGKGTPAEPAGPLWMPEAGDELLIWNTGLDAHSLSILSYDAASSTARTANYGAAGMSAATFPGARCSTGSLIHKADGWYYGKRKVQRVTKLAKVVPLITVKPNFSGPEWTDTFTGEVVDKLITVVENVDQK